MQEKDLDNGGATMIRYSRWMDFSSLGGWIAVPLGLIPVVVALVTLVALRGTKPEERADILLALAVFVAALVLRLGQTVPQRSGARTPKSHPNGSHSGGGVGPQLRAQFLDKRVADLESELGPSYSDFLGP